jgi:hypothetical protein
MTIKHFGQSVLRLAISLPLAALGVLASGNALAETACNGYADTYTANVVVFDAPMVFNRLGAQNPNWIMYALRRDVVQLGPAIDPDTGEQAADPGEPGLPEAGGGILQPGNVALRQDKRPRPFTLRVPRCSKLTISFQNLLADPANPVMNLGDLEERLEGQGLEDVNNNEVGFPVVHIIDDQVKTRFAGVHVQGMQLDAANGMANDSSYVGNNANSCVGQGAGTTEFTFLAEHEGGFKLSNPCAAIGGEASGGNSGLGMWGVVAVQPKDARIYRSQVYEEELRLAADKVDNDTLALGPDGLVDATTDQGHPIIDYEALYPDQQPWIHEGKANLPILNMICNAAAAATGACALNEIVHSEINAIVAGPQDNGHFLASTDCVARRLRGLLQAPGARPHSAWRA